MIIYIVRLHYCNKKGCNRLYDRSLNIDNEEGILEDKKNSCMLLQDLTVDFEEQLYNIKLQIQSLTNMVKEKENNISEIERTKDHNLNLFSPIYNKSYDTSEIKSEIEKIQQQIIELNKEKDGIVNKISGIKTAIQCIDEIIRNSSTCEGEKNSEESIRHSDNGLGILETQEVERQRIARELHDSTVQNLTSLVHKSELCIKLIDIDSVRAKLELNAMSNTLKMIINDMRGIIYNLKPMTLDDLGLTITVQRYANRIINLNNIQVKMTYNEEPKNILSVVKLTIFRVIQEACNNIIKHAKATFINIDIRYEENRINVIVKDNGIGFDIDNINKNDQSQSFGISIMKERISLLSGTINIESISKMGTIVTISVPLEIQKGEEK